MERKGKRIQDPLLLKTKQQQLQQKKPTKKKKTTAGIGRRKLRYPAC